MDKMWFQNGTTSNGENNKYRSEKYLPYAFTEQGIAMLSGSIEKRYCNRSKHKYYASIYRNEKIHKY